MKNLHNHMVLLLAVAIMAMSIGTAWFERTPMVVKAEEPVPISMDAAPVAEIAEIPEVDITFQVPEGWHGKEAKVGIAVAAKGQLSVAKVEARISEEGKWEDITSAMAVTMTDNGSLYIKVTDQNRETYTQNRYIECFDDTKPTLSAVAKDGVLIIRGTDAQSGVAAIYVNGNEFTQLKENTLYVRLQQADTSYPHFTLQVRDHAGNVSENYKVANPYYETPQTKQQTTDTTSGEKPANQLPANGAASKPTSATGTVTEHQTQGAANETGETSGGATAGSTSDGKGKEFYTIQTKGDKVFYLIVDKDKSSDNVYLLTEVGENDLLNFADSDMVTLPENNAVAESALPIINEKKEVEEKEDTTATKEQEAPKVEPEKSSGNKGTYILMGIALLGVGGAYYLKKVRGKRNTFEDGYDEGEDEDEEEEMEVYGDDDFEDKEESDRDVVEDTAEEDDEEYL